MGDRIPHQGPALEGHVTGEQPTDTAHQSTHQKCPDHEVMGEGLKKQFHLLSLSGASQFSDAASDWPNPRTRLCLAHQFFLPAPHSDDCRHSRPAWCSKSCVG